MTVTPTAPTISTEVGGILSLFGGDTEASTSNGICAWIVGELRMVEQLSADWTAKGTAGSTVTWMTILQDIAHIVVGIFSALALIIPTFGAIIPSLISESNKQGKQEIQTKGRAALQHLADTHKKALADQATAHAEALNAVNLENADLNKRIQDVTRQHNLLTKTHEALNKTHSILKLEYEDFVEKHKHHSLLGKLTGHDHDKKDKVKDKEKKDKTEKKDDHHATHENKAEKKEKGEHHGHGKHEKKEKQPPTAEEKLHNAPI